MISVKLQHVVQLGQRHEQPPHRGTRTTVAVRVSCCRKSPKQRIRFEDRQRRDSQRFRYGVDLLGLEFTVTALYTMHDVDIKLRRLGQLRGCEARLLSQSPDLNAN